MSYSGSIAQNLLEKEQRRKAVSVVRDSDGAKVSIAEIQKTVFSDKGVETYKDLIVYYDLLESKFLKDQIKGALVLQKHILKVSNIEVNMRFIRLNKGVTLDVKAYKNDVLNAFNQIKSKGGSPEWQGLNI